jgi:hypothetical protein
MDINLNTGFFYWWGLPPMKGPGKDDTLTHQDDLLVDHFMK